MRPGHIKYLQRCMQRYVRLSAKWCFLDLPLSSCLLLLSSYKHGLQTQTWVQILASPLSAFMTTGRSKVSKWKLLPLFWTVYGDGCISFSFFFFFDQVDLFKKSLLLIPIHLEVHWSLITVTLSNRIISFYDSQGIHFKFCVEVSYQPACIFSLLL